MKQFYILLVMLLVSIISFGQVTGDYRSNAPSSSATGYATLTNWETYDGSAWVAATALPTAANDVTIRSGHEITLNSNTNSFCKNLIVESGATLRGNGTSGLTNDRTININGTSFVNNGTVGATSSNDFGIRYYNNLTISGNDIRTIRIRQYAANLTLTLNCNVTFTNNLHASLFNSLTMGNIAGTSTINVAAGKKLTFESGSFFGWTTNSASAGSLNGDFNLNGDVEMLSGSAFHIGVNDTYTANLNISGLLKINSGASFFTTGAGIKNININSGGNIILADDLLLDGGDLNLLLNSAAGLVLTKKIDVTKVAIQQGKLDLGTFANTSSKLYLGAGVVDGVYGSSASGAAIVNDTYFAGTGTLTVANSTLGVGKNEIAGFKMYPNPVVGGKVFITTSNNGASRKINVFDTLGKKVVSYVGLQNLVDVSRLNKGVYVVKIEEEGKVATRKLVIE